MEGTRPNGIVLVGDGVSLRLRQCAEWSFEWSVVEVDGDLDMGSLPLRRRVCAATGPRVVFDFQRLAFIDASGLGLLAAVLQKTSAAGGSLRVAAPSGQVRRLLAITHLDQGIGVYDSLSDALAAPVPAAAPS